MSDSNLQEKKEYFENIINGLEEHGISEGIDTCKKRLKEIELEIEQQQQKPIQV